MSLATKAFFIKAKKPKIVSKSKRGKNKLQKRKAWKFFFLTRSFQDNNSFLLEQKFGRTFFYNLLTNPFPRGAKQKQNFDLQK